VAAMKRSEIKQLLTFLNTHNQIEVNPLWFHKEIEEQCDFSRCSCLPAYFSSSILIVFFRPFKMC